MPYPYTLMPDGHTLEPEEDEQAEESQSWLPSYIPPIVPPTPRPGLTSGESGGDGTSPPPLDVDPAVQEYERNLYQRLGITPPHESGEPTTGQSNPRPGTGASQTEDSRDTNHGKDETGAQEVLRDFEEVEEYRIDPADIKFYLAARHNPVLKELQLICQQENIPSPWKDRPDLLLWLCAEYGIDEENDAEARAYLDHITNGGSHHQNAEDSLINVRDEALNAFGTTNADEPRKAYTLAVEKEYGVEFKVAENADEWNLANIVMVHAALEMAASVFGDRLRDISGIDIDDATAFRLIFGPLTINHSTEVRMKAHAEVFGPLIEVYWKRKDGDDRNYNLYPYVLLHELGHRFNVLAGLGVREGYGSLSINENLDHPRSRDGMGASAYRPLDMVLGVPEEHGMYDEADLDATHVQLLQYGAISDHNEVTADAVLNWMVHQATGGESGFEDSTKGRQWLDFINKNMDGWIKNAIVYNAHRQGIIASLADEGLISSIAGTGIVIVPENSTATVRSTHSRAGAEIAHLRRDEEVLLLGESEPDVHGYPWNAVWAHDIYWVRSDLIRESWTERHTVTELKAKQWFPTLLELLARR